MFGSGGRAERLDVGKYFLARRLRMIGEELDSEGNPIVADESPEEGQQGQEGESAGDE